MNSPKLSLGFTLIEISIVLLIVTILLGYTLAMFPVQQELKQYREAQAEIRKIKEAVIGFAQINGRLPCPATSASAGGEGMATATANPCDTYSGFVPARALGLSGRFDANTRLLDPWGNPYFFVVADSDYDGSGNSDFHVAAELKSIGLVDSDTPPDGYIDLDANLIVCQSASTNGDDCSGGDYVVGDPDSATPHDAYDGAPVVIISTGKNGSGTATGDEAENTDGDTVFARPNGLREDFDDVVEWISSNRLFSKMIEAGQLP